MLGFRWLVVCVLILYGIPLITCQATCESGWFGTGCQYLCHCNGNCDVTTGACTDGTCETGWFGPACQYESSSYTADGGESWLFNNNCNDANSVLPVTVSLDIPHLLTWLRIVVSNTADLDQITIDFTEEGASSSTQQCPSDQRARVDETTMDIACPSSHRVTQITLSGTGVGGLCSLYISGGRNVALLETATQSSTYQSSQSILWRASYAVDGNNPHDKDYELRRLGCSQTPESDDPWWELDFGTPLVHINKINIWGRDDYMIRLNNFTLKTLDSQDQEVFLFTAGTVIQDYKVTVSYRSDTPVKKVEISLSGTDKNIQLCELFMFGDSACDDRKYGRECENDCNCLNGDACFVSTGGCPSGCALGFTGEDCYTPCSPEWYGSGCTEACSVHCGGADNLCSATDGVCVDGCDPGYTSASCDQPCAEGSYGQNCQGECSDYCTTANICDNVDGSCDCTDGYLLPLCKDKCVLGSYGYNCSNTCGGHCKGEPKSCHHVEGSCDQGCEAGYQAPLCEEECIPGTYGEGCLSDCSPHCLGDSTCDIYDGSCPNGCVDGYEPPRCQEQAASESSSGDVLIPAIVAAVAVVLLIAVVVAVILWRRRRGKGASEDTVESRQPPLRPVEGHNNASLNEAEPDYIQTDILPPPSDSTAIHVDALKGYILRHTEDDFFDDQFQTVPLKETLPTADGTSTQNWKKNRFKNILPYDATRVLLKSDAQRSYGDYINASHIKGYRGLGSFIASQGPNDAMQNDFMRMICEQRVNRIVMLTNVVEKGKKKCNVYWPAEGDLTFGNITVRLVSIEVFAEFTVRHLQFYESGESVREVTQFHFTAWPDKLVPDSPWGLIDFYHRVMEQHGDGPLLVHCSAGVGRTGTFIALCQLLQEAEVTDHMDFLSTLSRLRQDRMSMVQTLDQYKFLHWAALVGHVTSGTSIPVKDVADHLKALQARDGLNTEFQVLTDLSMEELYKKATKNKDESVYLNNPTAIDKQKNRLSNILPKEAYQVTLGKDSASNNTYINAVLVPTLRKSLHDILTQLPMPSTVTDFWRMVIQHQVGLIVAFDTDRRLEDETIGAFLPLSAEENFSNAHFEVQTTATEETVMWREVAVTVKKKNTTGKKWAKPVQLSCLMMKMFELSSQSLHQIMQKVKSFELSELSSTLYTCRNGASLSGLASVQSILLDKMKTDQCLSVPIVVGAMKAIRPQVIPTVDQYSLLYDVLLLEQESRARARLGNSAKLQRPATFPAAVAQDPDNIYSNIGAASATTQPPVAQNNGSNVTTAAAPPKPHPKSVTATKSLPANNGQARSVSEVRSTLPLAMNNNPEHHDTSNVYGNLGDVASNPAATSDRDVAASIRHSSRRSSSGQSDV